MPLDPYTGKPLPPSAVYPGGAPGGMQPPGTPQAPQAGAANDILQNPEALRVLLGTYGDQMEIDALEKQMAAAEALRMPTPEGRSTGRVYTAANPLEHLGKGIGDYKLMKKRKANEAAQAEARKRVGANVGKYGEAILGEE